MLENDGLRSLQRNYRAERPRYTAAAATVEQQLRSALSRAGIQAACSSRAKEIDSFLKKALKDKYQDPDAQIRDKAASRVVIMYQDDLDGAKAVVERLFTVVHREDKSGVFEREPNLLGYHGFHYEIKLPPESTATEGDQTYDIGGLFCEIQIQSRAQNLWNDASHVYLYKSAGDASPQIQRRIYRLVALMELFDDELCRVRSDVANEPGTETASMLHELEKRFFQMTAKRFDPELSIEVLEALRPLLSTKETLHFSDLLSTFVDANTDKLTEIYDNYGRSDDRNPLIFQPETILIFERMAHDRFALRERWERSFPPVLLADLGAIWGTRMY